MTRLGPFDCCKSLVGEERKKLKKYHFSLVASDNLFCFYITLFPSFRSTTFHIKGKTCYLSRTGIAKVPKETCYTLGFYEKVKGMYVLSCIVLYIC